MLRTIIFKLALAVWFVAWAPILLVSLIDARLCRYLVTKCARGVMWVARLFGGIKWKIHDLKNFKPGSIIAAKHMSIMEVAIIETTIPNAFFIIKRELMWIPIYGWAFWRMGLQPVNRAKGSTNMNKLVLDVAKKVRRGMTLVIFPEGTRAKPGHPVRLKRGLLFITEHLKLPITPAGTDSGLYWPKKGIIEPGTANVYFENALPYDASLEEIYDAINRRSA